MMMMMLIAVDITKIEQLTTISKAWYTLSVSTGRVQGPSPRPVNTGVQNDASVLGPWKRPVNTARGQG